MLSSLLGTEHSIQRHHDLFSPHSSLFLKLKTTISIPDMSTNPSKSPSPTASPSQQTQAGPSTTSSSRPFSPGHGKQREPLENDREGNSQREAIFSKSEGERAQDGETDSKTVDYEAELARLESEKDAKVRRIQELEGQAQDLRLQHVESQAEIKCLEESLNRTRASNRALAQTKSRLQDERNRLVDQSLGLANNSPASTSTGQTLNAPAPTDTQRYDVEQQGQGLQNSGDEE